MLNHPEVESENTLEPSIGEQLRLVEFNRKIEGLSRDELLEIAKLLAKQALVSQPSVIRYLAHEAARNLGGGSMKDWTKEAKGIKDALTDSSFDV